MMMNHDFGSCVHLAPRIRGRNLKRGAICECAAQPLNGDPTGALPTERGFRWHAHMKFDVLKLVRPDSGMCCSYRAIRGHQGDGRCYHTPLGGCG